MTLGFQTKWPERMGELAGQPNYFVEKIWESFPEVLQKEYLPEYFDRHFDLLNKHWDNHYGISEPHPKSHTIRADPHNRWKPGNKIHFVINNRTKDRFQFAPVVECVSVQEIEIRTYESRIKPMIDYSFFLSESYLFSCFRVYIDGIIKPLHEVKHLALNDGFPSVEAFFQYFNTDFKGNLIHWSNLKY